MSFDLAAQQLLLRLLEARQLVSTRYSLQHWGAAGEALLASGLFEFAGHETSIVSTDDDELSAYRLQDDLRIGELGYVGSGRGWVSVQQTDLERYRLSIAKIATMLFGDHLRQPRTGPLEVAPGLVWELGECWLVRGKPTQVWFARRLSDRAAVDVLQDATAARPPAGRRVVLTSTPPALLPARLAIAASALIPVEDVMDPHAPPRLDLGRLRARFEGRSLEQASGPLHLSDDNSRLRIHETQIFFGGEHQRRAIRIIVDAYRARIGVNAATTLQRAGFGPSVRTFRQAFSHQWAMLKPFLKSRARLWFLEP